MAGSTVTDLNSGIGSTSMQLCASEPSGLDERAQSRQINRGIEQFKTDVSSNVAGTKGLQRSRLGRGRGERA
jgi:hypothetical protein